MDYKPRPIINNNNTTYKKKRIFWFNSDFNDGFTINNNKITDITFNIPPFQLYNNNNMKVIIYIRNDANVQPIVIKLKEPYCDNRLITNTDKEGNAIIYVNHTGVEGMTSMRPNFLLIPQQIPRFVFRLDDNFNQLDSGFYFSSITNGSFFQVAGGSPDDKYLLFNSSGSFTLNANLNVDILVVGGGGGGGGDMGGGGGGGGVVYQTNVSLSAGNYSITVGAGGNGAPEGGINQGSITFNSVDGTTGNDSKIQFGGSDLTIGGITYVGKGGGGGGNYDAGGSYNGTTGKSGGSGGGAGGGFSGTSGGGSATQGNTYFNGSTNVAGGYAGSARIGWQTSGAYIGGGGGGAGGSPISGSPNGNLGVQVNITGTNSWYAAGGGAGVIKPTAQSTLVGGVGGNGIGGDGNLGLQSGAVVTIATKPNGTANTGAGGGGGVMYYNSGTKANGGGNGGSGVVIIRFRETRQEGITPVNNKPPSFMLGLELEDIDMKKDNIVSIYR